MCDKPNNSLNEYLKQQMKLKKLIERSTFSIPEIKNIPTINIPNTINISSFTKQLNKVKYKDIYSPALIDLGKKAYEMYKTHQDLMELATSVSKPMFESGVIRNEETLVEMVKNLPKLSAYTKSMSFTTMISMTDAMVSIRKYHKLLEKYSDIMKRSKIPNIDLYEGIIENLDESFYTVPPVQSDKAKKVKEPFILEEDKAVEEEVKIVNPSAYETGVTINYFFQNTEVHIHNSNVNDEEKSLWKEILGPAIAIVGSLFMTWAVSDYPITDTNGYKTIEKVIEIVQEYPIPAEVDGKPINFDKINGVDDLQKNNSKDSLSTLKNDNC